MRPTGILKELETYMTSIDYTLHVTASSRIFHMSGLWCRVARQKLFLTKKKKKSKPN